MIVQRPKLSRLEELYIPAMLTGLGITFKHFCKTLKAIALRTRRNRPLTLMEFTRRDMVTMQ